jgi:hypothetical protein
MPPAGSLSKTLASRDGEGPRRDAISLWHCSSHFADWECDSARGLNGSQLAVVSHPSRLEHDLEQQNDGADDKTAEQGERERPSAQSGVPGRDACPEGERQRLQRDDDLDCVGGAGITRAP